MQLLAFSHLHGCNTSLIHVHILGDGLEYLVSMTLIGEQAACWAILNNVDN